MLESVCTRCTWTPFIKDNWRNDISLGKTWNQGIQEVYEKGYDLCLVTNDDVLFAPYTIDAMIDSVWTAHADLVTAANVRDFIDPNDICFYPQPEVSYTEHPDFACFIITKWLMEEIGGFDEEFYPLFFEDNDYHYRMMLNGFRAVKAHHAVMYHFGSTSHRQMVDAQGNIRHEQFRRNQRRYRAKWGNDPGIELFSVPWDGKEPPEEFR